MQTIGNYLYNTRGQIGSGRFGTVYRGHHNTNPNTSVAVKCIEKYTSSKVINEEIKTLKTLNALNNENIVLLYDASLVQHHNAPKVYLIMEFCNGGNLAQYMEANGILSEDRIRFFLHQLANGMKALSRVSMVHRDLKPQNILITYKTPVRDSGTMTLKISDIGISRFTPNGQNAYPSVDGTQEYMAPEVKNLEPYTAKADMWSLGVIVYQCLTRKIFHKHFGFSRRTSKELESLLVGLLQRNVVKRFDLNDFVNHIFLVSKYISPGAEES